MGTRHIQIVKNDEGKTVLEQYGQWDGYPEGQGIMVLNFLREADLKKYKENAFKLREITEKEINMVNNSPNWREVFPYLSRDCGSDIHNMILNGDVKFIQLAGKDSYGWCEGFYTIDFQKGLFISEYHDTKKEFELTKLPTEIEYLVAMGRKEEQQQLKA